MAMFVVMVSVYIVAGAFKVRVDITADKDHTLSRGNEKNPGQARFAHHRPVLLHASRQRHAAAAQRPMHSTSKTCLHEYKQAANGKIVIEKLDPKPDSDAEDSARLNGVEGQATGPFGGNKIYLGIVVSMLDEKFALPWLSPDRERLLEYDISRAIARVENRTPPVVGIMSAFPVFGEHRSDDDDPGQNARRDRGCLSRN